MRNCLSREFDNENPRLWDFHLLKERILNLVNNDPHKKTFGCCDRLYWGWKLKDFPDLTKQYALYAFSILMNEKSKFEIDVFRGMVYFWLRFLNSDGSADQCFPKEKSSGPTLYVMHAILSSYDKILKFFKKEEIELLNTKIEKSIDFAIANPETYGYIANHRALFAHTYLLAFNIFHKDKYYSAYKSEIENISINFNPEGWFREYETEDAGYQTQCLHYLTLCFQVTRDEKIKKMVLGSIDKFLKYFVFPDGSFSGLFTGRATEIFYPFPFMYWSKESEICRQILSFMYFQKKGRALIKWYALDFENFIRLGTNYLLSSPYYQQLKFSEPVNLLPYVNSFRKKWLEAGIFVISDSYKYLLINLKRGGIFKLIDQKKGNLIEDTGYIIKTNKIKYSSSIFNSLVTFEEDGKNSLSVTTCFHELLDNYFNTSKLLILRLFSISLFKSPLFTSIFKKMMASQLMLRKKQGPISLKRTVIDNGGTLILKDTVSILRKPIGKSCKILFLNGRTIPFHMASSGYFHEGKPCQVNDYEIAEIRLKNRMELYTEVNFEGDMISIHRQIGDTI